MNQIIIPFKGWNLVAWANSQDGQARVAVKPICEAIGIAWQGQHSKLASDPRFNCKDILMVGADNKSRTMVTLPVEELNIWLCCVNSRKVKPEIAPLLLEFQKYCARVIYEATSGKVNQEVITALMATIEYLKGQIELLWDKLQEHENVDIALRNAVVSNASRTLQLGHVSPNIIKKH